MSNETGFLFNIVSNIGDGHQVQAAFNLPQGATRKDIAAVTDEFFAAIKRQAARLRIPAIEMEVGRQAAIVEGQTASMTRLQESPSLHGKRAHNVEAEYQRATAQLEADKLKLGLLEKNLELTYTEAELPVQESPCR